MAKQRKPAGPEFKGSPKSEPPKFKADDKKPPPPWLKKKK